MSFKELLQEFPVVPVSLPKNIYKDIEKEFLSSSPQQQGIIIENLFTLALKRIFPVEGRFIEERYYFADFAIDDHLIDVKATKKSFYPMSNITRGISAITRSKKSLSFILVWPEEWQEHEGIVLLRVHEIHSYYGSGKVEITSLNGSYKKFQI